ncbi:hypothetical protein [Rhodoferax sp. GW822-FHT02A01]|uniref:hypothetical protein n=1 Tax=Rhodoferax sp. GW822-FHT02A01 TaxID=3141537 RepID=UPI00315DEADC
MNFNQMRVILGVSSLKAYVTAPKEFHVIGIVRLGQEYGLLATDASGVYFRVNGSVVQELDGGRVRRAIDYAYGEGGRFAASGPHSAMQPAPVVATKVSIRKHRQITEGASQRATAEMESSASSS